MTEIVYDPIFEDYTHHGDLIFDLEKFVAVLLKLGKTPIFKIKTQ